MRLVVVCGVCLLLSLSSFGSTVQDEWLKQGLQSGHQRRRVRPLVVPNIARGQRSQKVRASSAADNSVLREPFHSEPAARQKAKPSTSAEVSPALDGRVWAIAATICSFTGGGCFVLASSARKIGTLAMPDGTARGLARRVSIVVPFADAPRAQVVHVQVPRSSCSPHQGPSLQPALTCLRGLPCFDAPVKGELATDVKAENAPCSGVSGWTTRTGGSKSTVDTVHA